MRLFLVSVSIALAACHSVPSDWVSGTVYLVAVGSPSEVEMMRAEQILGLLTQRPVKRMPSRQLVPAEEHPHCPSKAPCYDAGEILDDLLRDPPTDTFRIVGVTEAPMSAAVARDSIAFARHHERALLYTTASFKQLNASSAHDRTRQILSHELGHTFGAEHCRGPCVMQPRLTEHATIRACPLHRKHMVEGLLQSIDSGSFLAAVGRERSRLGRWDEAIDAYRRALLRSPNVVEVETALAVALMARGRYLEARDVLDRASYYSPRSPLPFYARAGLYASQSAPARAAAHLESGVNRDPNASHAHRFAGVLYQDVLRDDDAAIYHYRLHLSVGGRDPEVLGRLAMLLAPTTLVFTEPEVVVVQYDNEAGLFWAHAGWGE